MIIKFEKIIDHWIPQAYDDLFDTWEDELVGQREWKKIKKELRKLFKKDDIKIENYLDEITGHFKFLNKEAEAHFILWSSDGIEI